MQHLFEDGKKCLDVEWIEASFNHDLRCNSRPWSNTSDTQKKHKHSIEVTESQFSNCWTVWLSWTIGYPVKPITIVWWLASHQWWITWFILAGCDHHVWSKLPRWQAPSVFNDGSGMREIHLTSGEPGWEAWIKCSTSHIPRLRCRGTMLQWRLFFFRKLDLARFCLNACWS